MTTRAKNWILRPYLDSAHWIEEESTILVTDTFCVLTNVGLKYIITQKTTIQKCICVVCTLTSRHILFMLWRCIITLLNILYSNEETEAVIQTIFIFYFLTAVYISQWDVTHEDTVNILYWSLYIVSCTYSEYGILGCDNTQSSKWIPSCFRNMPKSINVHEE